MLATLFPKTFHKYSALPLLGSIADNFDDWLFDRRYTIGSRKLAINMLRHIDKDLRRLGVEHVTQLNPGTTIAKRGAGAFVGLVDFMPPRRS